MASPLGAAAEVRFRRDRDRAARQPLRDIVVGLTGESKLDAGTGECAERLARGAAKLQPDGPVQLTTLERTRETGAERSVGGRHAKPGRRDRTLAAECRRDTDLER